MTNNATASPRLYRSRNDRVIGGVCGGLATYLNVDVVIPRIIAIALLFTGSGFLLYLLAWIVIPEEPATAAAIADTPAPAAPAPAATSAPAHSTAEGDRGRWLLGGILVAVGSWLIIRNVADRIAPWLDDVILPMTLIAIGTAVLVYALRK